MPEYTLLQVAAEADGVFEAFTALEPGRSGRAELTRVAYERGWTGVRLDLPLATRFAPVLARVAGRPVLVWTVDADHCRVTLFRETGELVEAAPLDELVRTFRPDHPGGAAPPTGTPRERHVAMADLLGVPATVPGSPLPSGLAPPQGGMEQFRRQRRIRQARDWLHLASGFALTAVVLMVVRGPLPGAAVALALAGAMQLTRYWLGRRLRQVYRTTT